MTITTNCFRRMTVMMRNYTSHIEMPLNFGNEFFYEEMHFCFNRKLNTLAGKRNKTGNS